MEKNYIRVGDHFTYDNAGKLIHIYKDGINAGVAAMFAYYPEIDTTIIILAKPIKRIRKSGYSPSIYSESLKLLRIGRQLLIINQIISFFLKFAGSLKLFDFLDDCKERIYHHQFLIFL